MPIRAARESDLAALIAIETQCFSTDRLSRRSLRYFVSAAGAIFRVAAIHQTVCGYALASLRTGLQTARLYSIAVAPDARDRGLGRRLLHAAEVAARRRGATMIRLEVRMRNRRAIGLYESSGYLRLDKIADYYGDGAPALRYEKSLVQRVRTT